MISEKDIKRFFSKVEKQENGCELYKGALHRNGYGRITVKGKKVSAHRFAWMLYFGEIPEGMNVLHKCDVRNCCAKEHLFLGTQKDNMQDMMNKGRYVVIKGRTPMLGKKHSEETKLKMSVSQKGNSNCLGYKHSEETRKNMSLAQMGNKKWLGKKHTEETKEILRIKSTGRRHSEEALKKMSEAAKGRMNMLGKKHTEETKIKISEAHKGRVFSDETRSRMSEAAKKRCARTKEEKMNKVKLNKYKRTT